MSDRENFRKFRSGIALRVLIAIAAAVAVASPSLRAQPVLFHEHGHGLSFSSGAKALLAPSRPGGGVPVVSADAPVEIGDGAWQLIWINAGTMARVE